MNIILTNKAKLYLKKKNDRTVTIDLFVANSCIEIAEATVSVGKPLESIEKFNMFNSDGYSVYIFKGVNVKESGLVINAKNILGMKFLDIEGVKLF
jgi:hypothetical protein